VEGVRAKAIRVCGYTHKESLKFALFFIDPNVTVPEAGKPPPYYWHYYPQPFSPKCSPFFADYSSKVLKIRIIFILGMS